MHSAQTQTPAAVEKVRLPSSTAVAAMAVQSRRLMDAARRRILTASRFRCRGPVPSTPPSARNCIPHVWDPSGILCHVAAVACAAGVTMDAATRAARPARFPAGLEQAPDAAQRLGLSLEARALSFLRPDEGSHPALRLRSGSPDAEADLRSLVAAGVAPIVMVDLEPLEPARLRAAAVPRVGPALHCLVVTGYDASNIYVNDSQLRPAEGCDLAIPWPDFRAAWLGDLQTLGRGTAHDATTLWEETIMDAREAPGALRDVAASFEDGSGLNRTDWLALGCGAPRRLALAAWAEERGCLLAGQAYRQSAEVHDQIRARGLRLGGRAVSELLSRAADLEDAALEDLR